MIINNGIINIGNNNTNIIDINFEEINKELLILSKYSEEDLNNLFEASKKKDKSKLLDSLKKLKKVTIKLIKSLGLTALERLIESIIF